MNFENKFLWGELVDLPFFVEMTFNFELWKISGLGSYLLRRWFMLWHPIRDIISSDIKPGV